MNTAGPSIHHITIAAYDVTSPENRRVLEATSTFPPEKKALEKSALQDRADGAWRWKRSSVWRWRRRWAEDEEGVDTLEDIDARSHGTP